MGVFDILDRAVRWAADQVQTTTGEKERREEVAILKQLAKEFKTKVAAAILKLNEAIQAFNSSIIHLNHVRNTKVKNDIDELFQFLSQFGNCKSAGSYAEESEKIPVEFPQHEMEQIQNYIADVDWSQDDVFWNTFWMSPIGMKMKTRKQNLSMREHINELRLQTEATLIDLKFRTFSTERDNQICALYIANIEFISKMVSEKILPELELIEAFFQAEQIKNQVISNRTPENINFTYDIRSIKNTVYHRHYQFIKNTLAFYVISCRIYNTPVLTNLLNNDTTDNDIVRLNKEHTVLESQSKALSHSMVTPRGGSNNGY